MMRKIRLAALVALSMSFWAGAASAVTNLGTLSTSAVQSLSGRDDLRPFPDLMAAHPNGLWSTDAFNVVTFTLATAGDVRLDVAWRDYSGFKDGLSSAYQGPPRKALMDFSLRDTSGAALTATGIGDTFFNDSVLHPSWRGALPIPPTQVDEGYPMGLTTVTTAYQETEKSKSLIFKGLGAGSYSFTVMAYQTSGTWSGGMNMGVYVGGDFAAYQNQLSGPNRISPLQISGDPQQAAWHIAAVPEPATWLSMGVGLFALGWQRRRTAH